jgi:predicted transcriptional regulator
MQTKYFRILEELKVDIQITDDKISISSVENNAPIWVLIKHREIAHAFSEIFHELWKALDRIEELEGT